MAANINEYFADNGYNAVVTARGAVDIELGYGGPVMTRHWADAYNAAPTRPNYVNFGDASGCQDFDTGSYDACGTTAFPGWSSGDVHYVSWEVPVATPFRRYIEKTGSRPSSG